VVAVSWKPAPKADGGPTTRQRATASGTRGPAAPPAAKEAPRARVATEVPTVLAKGTPIQMLSGKYQGWTGPIRWIRVSGSIVAYTADLTGPDGATARNQVRHASLGKTWALAPDAQAPATADAPPAKVPAPAPAPERRPKRRRGTNASSAGERAASGPADLVPKGTLVRVLKGKYAGKTGVVGYTQARGTAVVYTVNMARLGSKQGRTQVNQGSLGRTWEVVGNPAAATASESVHSAATAVATTPMQSPGILARRTPIKMLTGKYLGYTGTVTTVHVTKAGPKPEAIYMLALTGPDGSKARTSVKQSSLGRTWVKAG